MNAALFETPPDVRSEIDQQKNVPSQYANLQPYRCGRDANDKRLQEDWDLDEGPSKHCKVCCAPVAGYLHTLTGHQ